MRVAKTRTTRPSSRGGPSCFLGLDRVEAIVAIRSGPNLILSSFRSRAGSKVRKRG